MWLRGVWIIVLMSMLSGCLSWIGGSPAGKSSTFRHQLERDQLVIHSDFMLPSRHRLIEDLRMQRGVLNERLQLAETDEPIHVYLFSDEKVYREFVEQRFPAFADRRAVFAETDIELSVYAHWSDHIAEDLRHEVSHGYLHAAIPGLPIWLDEGLAEYFEVSRGLQGVNAMHLDYLLAKIDLENWQPKLERLEQLPVTATMTQADYAEAWAWVHFLLESDDKSQILIDHLRDLRSTDQAPPLSDRINRRLAGPELALVEHLQSLR